MRSALRIFVTAQSPERFTNLHPRIKLPGYCLYFVSADLPVKPCFPDGLNSWQSSGLWRGYIGSWRLNVDGTLVLLSFEFPDYRFSYPRSRVQRLRDGIIHGDFCATFRTSFFGDEIEIPFIDGQICEDHSTWKITRQPRVSDFAPGATYAGKVVRRIRGGFLVWIGVNVFLPDKYVSVAAKAHPKTLVGTEGTWRVVSVDAVRKSIEIEPTVFDGPSDLEIQLQE